MDDKLHQIGTRGMDLKLNRAKRPASSTAALDPSKQSYVERSVETLKDRILRGEYGEAGILPSQYELGQDLGVSRPIIREAMRVLESQGLIDVSQGRRPRVHPVESKSVVDALSLMLARGALSLGQLVEIRCPLESEAAAITARRAHPRLIDQLSDTIYELRKAPALEQQVEADRRFHELLAGATENPLFMILLESLAGLLTESRKRTLSNVGPQVAADDHAAILEAIISRDSETARLQMLTHLRHIPRDLVSHASHLTRG